MLASLVTLVIALVSNLQTAPLPKFLSSFVEPGTRPIDFDSADLNGDGLVDFVVVLEKTRRDDVHDVERAERTLLVLVKTKEGFKLAVRAVDAIQPDDCGGVFGDCFQGIEAAPRSIIINEYGGSSWRWSTKAVFRYSKRDETWELVRYESQSFHVSDPDAITKKILTPKQFGKVKIADYSEQAIPDEEAASPR